MGLVAKTGVGIVEDGEYRHVRSIKVCANLPFILLVKTDHTEFGDGLATRGATGGFELHSRQLMDKRGVYDHS
jgi:hypothetical protein